MLILNLVALTGRSWAIAEADWPNVVADRLFEGAVPARHTRALADSFDKYLGRALKEANASNTLLVEAMGAFRPSPPDWAQPLFELIERLHVQLPDRSATAHRPAHARATGETTPRHPGGA